ncbi:hypothetical protein [Celeribacter indicus]|uniref:Uncharacterized protein n=1 Tax=Celeribacter indicus TaxID=1208324 RepID=A0A0B5DVT5_9RHOB|nr:hypothetical protein [Celeribacter indicus]AJE47503.1 hypothetical protein P73_2788 [Celeribacter indicus]SDW08575.1 hypothetical protein SAMN05443573_101347 [Celeribacter indicus]
MTSSIKTTAIFLRPFELPSFNEALPPGEYEIETQLLEPVNWIEPGTWTSSVLVRLHPHATHPGPNRTLTVQLAELENAVAKDKLTGKALTDFFLEEMLADPMIRLVMLADGVAEADLRALYSSRPVSIQPVSVPERSEDRTALALPHGGDPFERSGPRIGSARPGIGE